MKAWRVHTNGDPREVMRLEEIPEPEPGPGELLVRVRATGVNYPDALLCRGEYQAKAPLPFTPGVELCGEVVAVGEDTGWSASDIGSRVITQPALPSGGLGELTTAPTALTRTVPNALDDAEAAALHIGYQTGWFGLHRRAALQPGETLLVHAASGGVGSAAVQLGKAAGARVIGVVGGSAKAETARELGCDVVIDRREDDIVASVKEATDGRGADVVYDPVGGEAYAKSAKCVAFEGRILIVGFASGSIPSPALNHALVKNYSIVGLHWGLYNAKDPAAIEECHGELTKLAEQGAIKPLISERLPLEQASDAVQRVYDGVTTGRLVVMP